jgi:hypothetical protein
MGKDFSYYFNDGGGGFCSGGSAIWRKGSQGRMEAIFLPPHSYSSHPIYLRAPPTDRRAAAAAAPTTTTTVAATFPPANCDLATLLPAVAALALAPCAAARGKTLLPFSSSLQFMRTRLSPAEAAPRLPKHSSRPTTYTTTTTLSSRRL